MLRIISLAAWAQQPCAECHKTEADLHAKTNHARTLRPAGESGFARSLPDRPLGEARGGFLLTYSASAKENGLAVRAERGGESAEGRMEWVLGAGDQGLTPLIKLGSQWLEHRISYYPKADRFDLTLGHQPGASRTAKAALGVVQTDATIKACLGCHGGAPPGLSCENCHAGAAGHARGEGKASKPSALCTECHRLDGPNDALAVRFQPLRLVKSQCFVKGQVTCANCHPAHRNAVRDDPGFYRVKCAACHASEHVRSGRDCLPCHMPKSTPAPYLTFTDHFIRR